MKKFLSAVILIFIFSSVSFGAVSEDKEIYLRRDVFDAKMDALMAEMRLGFQSLREELHNEIQSVKTELHEEIHGVKVDIAKIDGRIDGIDGRIDGINGRIDGIDKRIDMLANMVYWILAFIGFIFTIAALPIFGRLWEILTKNSSKNVTIEDIERLIDAKINSRIQV